MRPTSMCLSSCVLRAIGVATSVRLKDMRAQGCLHLEVFLDGYHAADDEVNGAGGDTCPATDKNKCDSFG